LYDDF